MRHYLDLIPISEKVHKRQTRMTRLCIVFAVFLVAVIFGMADMEIQSQIWQSVQSDGGWHAGFKDLTQEQAAIIRARPEVVRSSRYAVTNYRVDMGYTITGKETAICGFDETMTELFPAAEVAEGRFAYSEDEAVATRSIQKQTGADIGDTVTLVTPEGKINFVISGFTGDHSMLTTADAFGIFLNTDTYEEYFTGATEAEDFMLYVEFSPFCDIQGTITDICKQLDIDRDTVGQNTKLLGLMFQSDDPYMTSFFHIAAVLAVLVAVAGMLMISSSLNSNVAQRTEFFGMLRCLGAEPGQVARFVRREALRWCLTAIPTGLAASILVVWGLSATLRYLSPGYFAGMPVFGISLPGIGAGTILGLATVLLAVRSPAKKASKVSPLAAVSGNAGTVPEAKKAADTRFFHVDTALGIHHAWGSRKNFFLMAGSFAFSIILFLSFSPAIDFMNHAIRPLKPSTADLSVISEDNTCSLPRDLAEELSRNPAVRRVYGRSFAFHLPAKGSSGVTAVDLVSYERNQFAWAKVVDGSAEEAQKGEGVLVGYYEASDKDSLKAGDVVQIEVEGETRQVAVSGVLSDIPFNPTEGAQILICSEALFEQLTGQEDYTVIDMQLESGATDADVEQIREAAGEGVTFSDQRLANSEAKGAYYSFALCLYGFLVIIALISALSIINSISMSVSARMKQYGAMRAIGMSIGQVIRMVAAEAVTYVFWGILFGCAAGLALNRMLYAMLVAERWGTEWYIPVAALLVILLSVTGSVLWAVKDPAKRIRNMSVVETIGAE